MTRAEFTQVEAMHVLIEAKYHKGHRDEALDQALEFKEIFEQQNDGKALGHALLIAATLEFKRGNVEEASSYNTKAQAMFGEESDTSGEADALKMSAEIQWKKNEFKSAIRFAEKSRALYRELGKNEGEIACALDAWIQELFDPGSLYLIGFCCFFSLCN